MREEQEDHVAFPEPYGCNAMPMQSCVALAVRVDSRFLGRWGKHVLVLQLDCVKAVFDLVHAGDAVARERGLAS